MHHWGNSIAGPLGIFVAALLLPGGLLLLAWALYRMHCRNRNNLATRINPDTMAVRR